MTEIIWTKTDEAPALAGYSLLPIVRNFLKHADISVTLYDISLAGRIIAAFPENLTPEQQQPDHLGQLGGLVQKADTNIIKLPNISASVPQLLSAVKELQDKGYDIPDFPEKPETDEQQAVYARYAKILGSAVNPVLREGNADRRAAASVKAFARKHPHKMMKPWPEKGSLSRVAHMTEKDFYGTEKSLALDTACTAKIEFEAQNGQVSVLKQDLSLERDEVVDAAVMNVQALRQFYADQIDRAAADQTLLSLHLKATMMKVSDPVLFGHCVSVYFKDVLDKYEPEFKQIGVNVNNGLAVILDKIKTLPQEKREQIKKDIDKVYEAKASLAMVDSDKGITNLHLPNNVIVDASMPNVIRDGGKMWNKEGKLQDTVAMIPDRSYAGIYQAVIDDCKEKGQFDPGTMGSVSNVGLMAKKAEEYGSHDTTFEAAGPGVIRLVDETGNLLLSQDVEKGDIFRVCRTKDIAVQDWVKLGVSRAGTTGTPAIFWLDPNRGHDRQIIEKVKKNLDSLDLTGLDVQIMSPVEAIKFTLDRVRQGQDTIAVTGNVLRDYLTDLFPILELGTSARMLSIVPLLNGGGLFETGAGGSAPKHVEQFLDQGHLRWDSLGEYCALVPSLELAAKQSGSDKPLVLARALDQAIGDYLEQGKSPSRKANEPDNRGAAFYLALFWAKAMAEQSENPALKEIFIEPARLMAEKEGMINKELMETQGKPGDIGGYYLPDEAKAQNLMRPSPTLNQIIDTL